VLEQMKDPTFQDSSSQEKGGSDNKGTPSHLQDLGPEDLPEESRGIITREIAFFRERAAKKEALKREEEEERERRRTGGGRGFGGGFGHRGGATGGFGQRSGPQGSFGSPQNASANAGRAGSPAVGGTSANGFGGAQSHNRPLGFVRSGLDGAEADAAAIGADEDQERARQERRKREAEAAFAEVSA
jgi:RNA-binding protein 25